MPRSGRHARHSNSLLARFFEALRALKAPTAQFGSTRRVLAALLAVTVATLGIAATSAQAAGMGDVNKTLDATQGAGFTAPNTFTAGSLVRYNLKVSCSSNTSDCGISTLVDTLPAGVTFKNVVTPVTSLPLNVSTSGQTVTITIGDATTPWPDSNTLEFVLVGTVTGTVTGTLNNQASITTNGGTNLSLIVPIKVPTPTNGLSVTKSVTPTTIAPGEIATYTMRFSFPVTAQGQTPPTGATMVDTYPAGAIPVLADGTPIADGGTTADGGVVNLAAHTITYTYTAAQLDPTKANCSPVTYCVMGDKALSLRFPSPTFAAGDTPVNVTKATFSFADGTTSTSTAQATLNIQTSLQAPALSKSGPTTVAPNQTFSWTINATNGGNGTVTNYSVTDTLPTSGVGSLIIYGDYAPTYEPITGTPTTATFEYMDASGTWQPWFVFKPGDPFAPRAVPTGALAIRVTAASLTPKSQIYFQIKATVTGDVGTTFKNCASLTGDGLTTPPADACVTSTVNAPFSSLGVYKGHVFADSGATSVAPGDTFIYYVNVRNTGGVPLTSFDLSDVLPSAFTYVKTLCTYDYPTLNLGMTLAPNSWYTPCDAATAIEPTVTADTPTAGSTLLQWKDVPVTSPAVRDGANAMGIAFEVKVKPGTSVANYTNVADVNNALPGVTTQCSNGYYGTSTVTDTNDVNGDGSTTDIMCQNTNPVQVRQAAVADVFKWVKGDLGVNALETTGLPSSTCPDLNGYTRYPCVAEVSRGGTFDYLFQHVNTGNVQMTDFTMYDILPHVGDTGVNQVLATSPRNTVWDPVLTGPVTLDPATVPTGANPVILYSLSYDPCRPELAQGAPGTNWQGAACTDPVGGTNVQNTWYTAGQITDWSTVKSFKISMFTGQTDQALAWQPGAEIVAHAPMQAPTTAPESTQSPLSLSAAWNSIAHQEARLNADGTTNPLLSAAPRKVGIIVPFPGVSVGDYVWFDQNHDGLQSPGETPIAGVTVTLKDASGAVVKTTTTDANGYYSFLYLTPSTQYTVEFTAPTGMTFTTPNASGVTSNDPIADNGTTALNGTTGGDSDAIPSTDGKLGSVTFTSPAKDGSTNLISSPSAGTVADNPGLDAGFVSTMNLKLTKKLETAGPFYRGKTVTYTLTPSNDGPMDALKGWSVTDLAPAGMTITDMTGANYTCDVATGTCTSLVSLPAGKSGAPITVTSTINADAVLGSDQKNVAYISPATGDVKETNVLVVPTLATDTTASTTDNDAQATLTLANAVSIGDYVWYDTNRDGIQQTTEAPVAGVTVNLFAADGTTLVGSTVTDSTGFYSFANLTPSTTYVVEFVKPAGTTFTTQTSTGSTTANDSNPAVTTGRTTVTTPAAGTNSLTNPDDPTIDAGLVKYNLTLAKALTSTGTINPGGTVTFNLTPHNDGPVDALAGWSVTDLLPAGLTLVSMTGTGYDCSGNVCTATAPLAAKADGPVIKVTATVDASFTSGSLKNVAYVKPSTDDAVETNPLGTTPTTATNTSTSPTDNDAQATVTITPLVSIGDYVWYDTNRDGIQNNGEPAYAGMTVQLLDANGGVVKTTTTDANGYYYFADLSPSTAYTVKFVAAAGESFTTQTAGSSTAYDSNPAVATGLAPVTTPADGKNQTGPGLADDPTIDAGVVKYNLSLTKTNTTTGAVYAGSTVTFDLTPHNDGPVDALAGWSVTDLLPTGLTLVSMTGTGYDCTGNVCTATAPLAAGADGGVIKVTAKVDAKFVGGVQNVAYVQPSSKDAEETNPLGTPPTNSTDTTKSPTDNDASAPVTVDSLVSIGDYVWWDTNRNGVQDKGEAPVAGVTVTLYQADGTQLGTTTTDANGFYSFTDLTPGQPYYVIFTSPADASFTQQNAGANDTTDSDANVATGRADFVAPASGKNSATTPDDPTIDAGLVKLNLTLAKSLTTAGPFGAGDTVTFTLTPHNDGPVDALAGWTVSDLLPTGLTLVSMTGTGYDCTGNVCTATAPLAAGADGPVIKVTAKIDAYTTGTLHNVAWVAPVSGDTPETNPLVIPSTGTDTSTTATDNDAQASLTLQPVSIGDYVWWDTNRNGVQDKGEAPVAGVTVTLYQADGKTKVAQTKTDANGFYSFTDLAPGQAYVVVFTKPDGTTFTTPLAGDTAADSNPNSSGIAPVTTPLTGTNSATTPDDPTIDAGLVKLNLTLAKSLTTAGPFGAGDTVTFTLTPHNDGPVDALAGWTVSDLLPKGLTLVSITGDAKAYSCDNNAAMCTSKVALAAGQDGAPVTVTAKIDAYTTGTLHNVAWVAPVSGDTPETNPLVIPSTGTDTSTTATDNDAQASLTLQPVSIGDYVWWDTNRNGVQDKGEAPVAGVTVTLYQADGKTKVAQTKTDANGFYSFTDLAPGQAYVVVFTKPDGTTFTTQTVGTDKGVDSNADTKTGAAPVVTPKTGSNSKTNPDDPTIDAGLWQLNLSLTKSLTTKGKVKTGDLVTFVLVPHNDGPVDALAGWSVTEVLPTGLTLVSMKGDGYTCTTATATCTSSAVLPAGQDGAIIWVTAKITAKTSGSLRNVAYVAPAKGEIPETNPLTKPKPGTDTSKTKTDNDADAVITFTAPTKPGKLPHTGTDGLPEVFGGGLLLVALGGLLKLATRRREQEV